MSSAYARREPPCRLFSFRVKPVENFAVKDVFVIVKNKVPSYNFSRKPKIKKTQKKYTPIYEHKYIRSIFFFFAG